MWIARDGNGTNANTEGSAQHYVRYDGLNLKNYVVK